MDKLEQIRKQLTHFPQGVKATDLADSGKFGSKTTVYEVLNRLKDQRSAFNQNGLWFAKTESDKIVKPGWLERRSERKRQEMEIERKEGLARRWDYMELIAKLGGPYARFKDMADMEKRNRKELGLG
jgi:hypothetical protein